MAIDTKFSKGQFTSLSVAPILNGNPDTAVPPTPVTIIVAIGGAARGATTLPVEALTTKIRKNTILDFDGVKVVVTEDTDTGAEILPVDGVMSVIGGGIDQAIDAAVAATWDRTYRVLGTETADFSSEESTTDYVSNTYDSGYGISYTVRTVENAGWSISRAGRSKLDDYGFFICYDAGIRKVPVWVQLQRPGFDNKPAVTHSGAAWVTGLSDSAASTAMADASWTFTGTGALYTTYDKPFLIE